jgi:integrase
MLVATPQQKLSTFLVEWLEKTQKHDVRPRAYERYEEIVRLHINPTIGHHYLQKLTPNQIKSFYAKKLDEGYAASTVNSFHNVLHKALDTAVRWNLIPRNICDLVDPPHKEEYEAHPLNLEQLKKLLTVAQGHPTEALITLTLATGLRRGEILGLKWQDIDMEDGTLQIRRVLSRVPTKLKTETRKGYVEANTKTKKSRRRIIIASFALEALKKHRERQKVAKEKAGPLWKENDLVFCTSIGTFLNPDRDVRVPFKKLLQKAELPDVRFHDLRHSAATLLLGMGVHPKIVQEILGHSNIAITMNIYSHVLPTMQQEAMKKLNAAFKDMTEETDEEDEEDDIS